MQNQECCVADLDLAVDEHPLHALVLGEGLAENLALLDVVEGHRVGFDRHADAAGRVGDPRPHERRVREREAAADFAE